MAYTYGTATYSGIILHYMKTAPSNIVLRSINSNVTASGHYGINGGFFYADPNKTVENWPVLSLTVNNDVPVGTLVYRDTGTYGSGWANVNYARGTVFYDGVSRALGVRVVSNADQISVTNRSNYWAQGGVSMSLQDETNWRNIAVTQQNLPNPDGVIQRAGLVYSSSGYIYLVMTASGEPGATAAQFRQAIKQTLGALDGVFLDSSGSAQMLSAEFRNAGDGRKVKTMVGIIS
ncbi:phosphodiester glycosidase family protein [Deinococcus sp. DB0503]|uniref:phosphodiester glycosidase family protein n=1 Tax=Deinococcus sp. DB0503 TaxID=2479203 RepID=UPI0018DFEE32|nr:phosphodiester glycosidase family protein [Deinococcus sp. DB0503]